MRFQASITADDTTMTVINKQDAITEGMLITAYNLYTGTGDHTLDLKSTYTTLNVENGVKGGWYAGKEGTYCGSIVNIQKKIILESLWQEHTLRLNILIIQKKLFIQMYQMNLEL